MISAGDFRNGITIEYENSIYQIIEFQHVKPGKGAAFVRTKLKNIICGEDLPPDREVSAGAYRQERDAVLICRWRFILFYGYREL